MEVHKALSFGLDEVLLALAPSGMMIYNVRLQGIGRIVFSIKEDDPNAKLVNIRTGELEKYPWTNVMEMLETIINPLQSVESEWERIYGEPFPGKEEVAPVQQEKPAEKPRKESKVVKSKPIEKKPEPKPVQKPESQVAAEQLPGQMDIGEFKEVLPEEMLQEMEVIAEEDIEVIEKNETPEVAEKPETRIPSLEKELSAEEAKKEIVRHKAAITSAIRNMPRHMAAENWEELGKAAMDIKFRADKIIELEGK